MRGRGWWAALMLLPGCYQLDPFACADDSDCSSRADGVCLAFGCAYPDDDCMSGLRYSDLAVGTISGACVEPEGPGSSSSSTTDDDASGSVGEPIGCDAVDCGEGACVLIDDEATCACGPGLHAVAGPTCVSDPCASARCFYVDADAPEGGDGSLEAPWSTLDSVEVDFPAVQQPGDHVLLRRGSRWADSLLLDDIVGTEDAPIVLGAYGDDPAAPVLARVRVFNSTFVTVRDLEIDGTGFEGQSGIRAQFVDHLIVRDNYVHDVLSEGIGMHYGAEHTVIINNRVERVSPAETSPDPGLIWVADDWWNENSTDIGDHHYIVDNVLVGLPPMDEEATDRGIVLSNRDGVGDFKVLGNRVTGVVRQGLWFQGRGYGWILHNTLGGIDGASFMPPSGGGWWGAMIVSHESKVRVRGNQVFSAALPFLIGAGGGRGEFEIEGNTFAGGAEGWSLWLGDASGRIENNLVVPDPNAAVHTTDTLERLEGLSLANNVYASESCTTGVFGEEPMNFEQWQEMGYDEGSVCAPVPGVSSVTNFPDNPANWGALEGLVPAASWEGCDAPAGAFDCDGQPTQGGLQTWPSMPDNGGRGWEGPALVRARYPIE